jgi:hypothetical protein
MKGRANRQKMVSEQMRPAGTPRPGQRPQSPGRPAAGKFQRTKRQAKP